MVTISNTASEQKVEEFKGWLRSTDRPGIPELIAHLEKMGFFIAPGSKSHHRFIGGLLSHSLETYHKALEIREGRIRKGVSPDAMPIDSLKICCLLHDVCKADALRYDVEHRRVYDAKETHGHSARSVRQIGYSGFILTGEEKDAILWHMGGSRFTEKVSSSSEVRRKLRDKHFEEHPLAYLTYWADSISIKERHLSRHKF